MSDKSGGSMAEDSGVSQEFRDVNRRRLRVLMGYVVDIRKLIILTDQVDADMEALNLQNEIGKDIGRGLENLENQLQKKIADVGVDSFSNLKARVAETKKNNAVEIKNLGKKTESVKAMDPEKAVTLLQRLNKLEDQNRKEKNLINIKTELTDIEGVVRQIEGDSDEIRERIKRLRENAGYLSKLIEVPSDIESRLKKLVDSSDTEEIEDLMGVEEKLRGVINKNLPGTDIRMLKNKVIAVKKENEVAIVELGRVIHNIRKLVGKKDELMDSFDILHGLRERNMKEKGLMDIKKQITEIKSRGMEEIQGVIRNERVAKTCSVILEGKNAGGMDIPEIVDLIGKANTSRLGKLRKCIELTKTWLMPGYRFRDRRKLDDLERKNRDEDNLIHIGDELDSVEAALREDVRTDESLKNVKEVISFVSSLVETDPFLGDTGVYPQLTAENWDRGGLGFILAYDGFTGEVRDRRDNLLNLIDTVDGIYPASDKPKKTVDLGFGGYRRFIKDYRRLLEARDEIKKMLSVKLGGVVRKTGVLGGVDPRYLKDLGYLKDGLEVKINDLRGSSLEENPAEYLNKLVGVENDVSEFNMRIRGNAMNLFTAELKGIEANIGDYMGDLRNISY